MWCAFFARGSTRRIRRSGRATSPSSCTTCRRDKVAGGATYDALIAAVGAALRLPLVTCDRRALATYRRFDVAVELLA
jgi:hypothetical protein